MEILCRVVAICAFDPTSVALSMPDVEFLTFEAGQHIDVVAKDDSGWWEGALLGTGVLGLFPGSHVQDDSFSSLKPSVEPPSPPPIEDAGPDFSLFVPSEQQFADILADLPDDIAALRALASALEDAIISTDTLIMEKKAGLQTAVC